MRSLSRRVLTLALATLPVAMAVRPPESTTLGDVPVRLPAQHRGASAAFERSPAWSAFVAGEGAGWEAQWDAEQAVPFRMWGGGIAVPASSADEGGKEGKRWPSRETISRGLEGDCSLRAGPSSLPCPGS